MKQDPATQERLDQFAKLLQDQCNIPSNWAYAILRSVDYWKRRGLLRVPDSATFEPKPNGDGYTFKMAWQSASGKLFVFTLSSVYDTTKQCEIFSETLVERN